MNWPGAISGAGAPTGSSVTVHVSAVSCSRAERRYGRGVSAPSSCGSAVAVTIDVEKPESSPLQALDQHLRDPAHQLVAERRIGLALAAQTLAVEARRANGREGTRIEMPAIGREEPGPAEQLAGPDRLDRDWAARRHE